MATNMKENGFETLIVRYLVDNNHYEEGLNSEYNKTYAIDEGRLFRFLNDTQYKKMQELRIEESEIEKKKFLDRLSRKLSDDGVINIIRKGVKYKNHEYYKRTLENGEHIAYLVYDNETFIGAGGVSFYQVMPTYHNPTGKKAYIMNMYTASEYRRQGIAFHTLDLLVKDVRKQGVSQIALEATEMGRPLYEKYGFVKMEDEMELKLKHSHVCSN